MKKLNSDTGFWDRAYSAVQTTVLDYLCKRNVTEFNISNECRELFNQTFFNESSDWNQIPYWTYFSAPLNLAPSPLLQKMIVTKLSAHQNFFIKIHYTYYNNNSKYR